MDGQRLPFMVALNAVRNCVGYCLPGTYQYVDGRLLKINLQRHESYSSIEVSTFGGNVLVACYDHGQKILDSYVASM